MSPPRPLARSRSRRRLLGVMLGALALGAVVVGLTAARTTHHHPAAAQRPPARTPALVPPSPPPARPSEHVIGSRTIDHVLHYTSFLQAGSRRHRLIALTFDDGPSPYTRPIVSTLLRLHAAATFFVVGQQLRYFSAGLRYVLRHGFPVGDHTLNHAFLPRLSASGQRLQIAGDAAALRARGAPPVRLFRPPYGSYDAATLAIARRLRMLMVLWSDDPSDWRRPGTARIVRRVLALARPGAIVLMHDGGGDRSQTLAALPAIVRGLRRRGFQLVTVPELLHVAPPPPHQRLPTVQGT